MSAQVIDPDYNWKQAAAQEGVDYDAVKKSFMDQAYGVVANKAKVLFRDPFRLGFEIVHRNEKATKMVGIFAFRCNNALLYAPVFFVNGEIKAADMLYRADVKRFVPLTDDWCSFLVRGANMEAGQLEEKSRQRQTEAYMDRLAYPQRIKYASDDYRVLDELLLHCADDSPVNLLIPSLINEQGPAALEKLASLIEDSDIARKFVVENYTHEQLTTVDAWTEKQAAEAADPEANSITIVTDPMMAKSATERADVMDHGYALIDRRPAGTTNIVIEELDNGSVHAIATPGHYDVLMSDGTSEPALVLSQSWYLMTDDNDRYPVHEKCVPNIVYTPSDKQMVRLSDRCPIFGDQKTDGDAVKLLLPTELVPGRHYVLIKTDSMQCSPPFKLLGCESDGECEVMHYTAGYEGTGTMYYAPGRPNARGRYISDDARFVEIAVEPESDGRDIRPSWTKVLMDGAGIDQWIRTGGGITKSIEVKVTKNPVGLFDVTSTDIAGLKKVARDLGKLEAHLKLATDFDLTCDAAGNILSKVDDDGVTRFRVYDSFDKSAFVTRMQSMQPWITGIDPELNVRIDAPQRQVVLTHTPKRNEQVSRYGDHWDRGMLAERDPEEDGLPGDAIFTKTPEELATLASQYNMPHIFDHGALSQMATSMFNTVSQIQKYIPDLESGVDRYFRILFLLRYRPADFEEAYGKDELMEMEQELAELASMSGANLLRMLKRFDLHKYTTQTS